MKARMAHLTRVLDGRGRGAQAIVTYPHSRAGQSPYLLKICHSKIDITDQRGLRHQAAALSISSRKNLYLLTAAPLSACHLLRVADIHIDLGQNQTECAPAEMHPLQMPVPHPLKVDGKKPGVSPVLARLASIHTSHPRIDRKSVV